MKSIKFENNTTKVFLQSCKIVFTAQTTLDLKNRYTYTLTQISFSQSLVDNLYWKRKAAKNLFYMSKKDKNQYINNITLLYYIIMRK